MKRSSYFSLSAKVELMDRVYIPPHTTDRWMVPFTALDYDFTLSPSKFVLMHDPATNYIIQITRASLLVRRMLVNPSVKIASETVLRSKNALYPISRTAPIQFSINQNDTTFNQPNLFTEAAMPRKLIFFMVPTASIVGASDRNPFFFTSQSLTSLELRVGDQTIPNTRYRLETDNNLRVFQQTLEGLAYLDTNQSPGNFNRDTFSKAMWIACWDLTRDANPTANYVNSLFEHRNLHLSGTFKTALTENYTGVVLGIFQSILEVDSTYTPSTNY